MAFTYITLILCCFVLGISCYTDIKYRRINNFVCVSLLIIWCVFTLIQYAILGIKNDGILGQIAQAFALLALLLLLSFIFEKLTGKESLGGGDIKMLASCSVYFSLNALLVFIIASCIIGALSSMIVKDKSSGFPFAPAISISFAGVFVSSNILMLF